MKIVVVVVSPRGLEVGVQLKRELTDLSDETMLFSVHPHAEAMLIASSLDFVQTHFAEYDAFVFVGALGICVRAVGPCLGSKYADPAVVNVDSGGRYVQAVASGHLGGANRLAERVARILGGEAVVTTQSDQTGCWSLDLLAREWGWRVEYVGEPNSVIAPYVNGARTAVLLTVRDRGTDYLERTPSTNVTFFYDLQAIDFTKYEVLIAVTPFRIDVPIPALFLRPRVLRLGMGCMRGCDPQGVSAQIRETLRAGGLSDLSVGAVATVELKQNEPLLHEVARDFGCDLEIYTGEQLAQISVKNPSEKVLNVTGTPSVAEAAALVTSGVDEFPFDRLLFEKTKIQTSDNKWVTFSVGLRAAACRHGFVEIVGAGPGDPELISVRGKRMLERADLILYAGSLVPVELTYYAKPGSVVRSSAAMTLESQFDLMKSFYDRGLFVVRLHTGDPCIYGAIQEQMAFFDAHGIAYHITPGISSFQAAAAALRSQFTIPEKVQTIILTRGEGRTPMPEREQLHLLARSGSTMCIFLSAGIVERVQEELLTCYPPTTPVAACYKLTWKDERIYRGQLCDLARIVKEHDLTLTTMLVVGEAIDNRTGLSRLYADEFKHLFRS